LLVEKLWLKAAGIGNMNQFRQRIAERLRD
jgi:hypothetical protein